METLYTIIGMFIGFMLIYMFAPCSKVIIKYPTLKNIDKTSYVDNNNVHYRYRKVMI